MYDTIYRQAAIDAFDAQIWGILNVPISKAIRKSAQETIKHLPSAQQEIIRCKDCKYYEIAWLKKDGTDNKRYKPSICVKGKYGITRNPDWFCADAERRTDG